MGCGFSFRPTSRAQARGTKNREPRSGTGTAIPRCLQRFDTPFKALMVFVYHGQRAGSDSSTPRVTNRINRGLATPHRMIVMKYYISTTQFNCGIDLHAHQMYVCLMDREGKKLVHTNIRNNDFNYFLKLVAPYRHDLTVCAECMFGWYWLADACQAAGIHFVLAHALYLKAIHGGKNKNDRIDSEKIAHLLRANLIPPAYVYPADKRPLRALLRQRLLYVWNRTELLARIQSHQLAHNRPTLRQTRPNRDPWEEQLLAQEDHPIRQLALQNDLALIRHYDAQLATLEAQLLKLTKKHAPRDFTLLQ